MTFRQELAAFREFAVEHRLPDALLDDINAAERRLDVADAIAAARREQRRLAFDTFWPPRAAVVRTITRRAPLTWSA